MIARAQQSHAKRISLPPPGHPFLFEMDDCAAHVCGVCVIARCKGVYLFPFVRDAFDINTGASDRLFLFFFSYFSSHIKTKLTLLPHKLAFPTRFLSFILSPIPKAHPFFRSFFTFVYLFPFSLSLLRPCLYLLFVIFPTNPALYRKNTLRSLPSSQHTLHTNMAPKQSTVVLLPGDGVGPEVTAEAKRVLELVAKIRSHKINITFKEELIGGASIDASGKNDTLACYEQVFVHFGPYKNSVLCFDQHEREDRRGKHDKGN